MPKMQQHDPQQTLHALAIRDSPVASSPGGGGLWYGGRLGGLPGGSSISAILHYSPSGCIPDHELARTSVQLNLTGRLPTYVY